MMKNKICYIGIVTGLLFCVFLSGCNSKSAMEFQTTQADVDKVENDGTVTEESKSDTAEDSKEKTNSAGGTSSTEQTGDGSSENKDYDVGESQTGEDKAVIYVHICGEVLNPGVYEMQPDERVFMLIEKAGGFTKDAATDYVNQAMALQDGDKVYIPSQAEAAEEGTALSNTSSTNSNSESSSNPGSEDGVLDLNTATEEDLMTLPGIGSSKAKKIIAYREEIGKFEKIEQIMDITGIKEGVYNNIKNYVIVR